MSPLGSPGKAPGNWQSNRLGDLFNLISQPHCQRQRIGEVLNTTREQNLEFSRLKRRGAIGDITNLTHAGATGIESPRDPDSDAPENRFNGVPEEQNKSVAPDGTLLN